MVYYKEIEQLMKQAKRIIKTNTIKDSMRKISLLKNPITEEVLGKTKAFKIYSQILRDTMVFIPKKHDNNIDLYFEQIKDKVTEAYSYV